MFTGFVVVKEVTLEQAAELVGKSPDAIRMMCNTKRGIPGAKKITWGKRQKWVLTAESIQYMRNNSIVPGYYQLVEEWRAGLESGRLTKNRNPASPATVHNYVNIGLDYFWQYSGAIKSIENINYANLETALLSVPFDRETENCGFAKKDMMYRAVRSLYKLLVIKGIRSQEERDSLSELKPRRQFKPKVKRIRKDGFDQILAANICKGTGSNLDKFHIECNKTIIYLMGLGGLRKHEVPRLKLSDVDFAHQELSIIGKGDKREIIGVPPELMEQLARWIHGERAKRIQVEHGHVVIQVDGSPITASAIANRIQRLEKKSGVKFSPHSLRHFCATTQADKGTPIHFIQSLLRHSDPTTTHRYIHADKQAARDAIKKPVF